MKLLINGIEKEVERVAVVKSGEPWAELLLEDGSVIRMRTIVTGVYRVLGEQAPDGRPLYQVQSTTIMAVD